jgi:hypothetical protein
LFRGTRRWPGIAGHANATVIVRLFVRDERNQEAVHADVLGRAAAAGFAA